MAEIDLSDGDLAVTDISLPGMEAFLFALACAALSALGLVVSAASFGWAHFAGRAHLRRRFAWGAGAFTCALAVSAAAAVALD